MSHLTRAEVDELEAAFLLGGLPAVDALIDQSVWEERPGRADVCALALERWRERYVERLGMRMAMSMRDLAAKMGLPNFGADQAEKLAQRFGMVRLPGESDAAFAVRLRRYGAAAGRDADL